MAVTGQRYLTDCMLDLSCCAKTTTRSKLSITTEKVFVDNDPHDIEVRPVTVVFNSNCGTFYPDRLMITPEMSLETFRALPELNAIQIGLFRLVVPDVEPTLSGLQNGHSGFQYLMGLIAATLNCILLRQKFGWKYPETGLHPKYQGNIADLAILLSDQAKFVQFLQAIKERTA